MTASADGLTAADAARIDETLKLATGGAAAHHALRLMAELADAACPGGAAAAGDEDGETRILAAIEAAVALAPRDPLEAMLVAQMAAVHAAAMRALRRAAECADHPQIEALYLRTAARLLNLFVRQAEALDRRARRQGRAEAARGPGYESCNFADAAEADPDGAEILGRALDAVRADLDSLRRERRNGAGEAEPHRNSGAGAQDPGRGGGEGP